jgi:Rieske 2Fe-2S family protein
VGVTDDGLEGTDADFTVARPLPTRAYRDAAHFERERRAIFERAWLCVGREEDVRAPGAWVRIETFGAGVIVARGEDGRVRAMRDACRHRGVPVVVGASGRAISFTCPYHAWRYGLDGALRDAPFAPEGFDRAAHGLTRLAVDTWHGFLFVNVDPDAAPLEAWAGAAPPWLERADLASLTRAHRAAWDVAANWKICAENFQESHHFPLVHPALEACTATARAATWLRGHRWLGGTMELADGVETVSISRRIGERRAFAPRGRVHDALLFPTLLTSLQPDYLLTYRLEPIAPERTRVIADVLVDPSTDRGALADVLDFWATTNAEDRAICERQQRGLATPGFEIGCYATVEEGVHAFDRLVARALVEAR